jgi:hypothetical protein
MVSDFEFRIKGSMICKSLQCVIPEKKESEGSHKDCLGLKETIAFAQ